MVCVNTGKILEIGGGGGVGVVVAVWWCDFSEILEISLEKNVQRYLWKIGFQQNAFFRDGIFPKCRISRARVKLNFSEISLKKIWHCVFRLHLPTADVHQLPPPLHTGLAPVASVYPEAAQRRR